jgi:hypothetical protein
VHFYGTHSVDIDGELAELDTDGYRPLRLFEASPGKWPTDGSVSDGSRGLGWDPVEDPAQRGA